MNYFRFIFSCVDFFPIFFRSFAPSRRSGKRNVFHSTDIFQIKTHWNYLFDPKKDNKAATRTIRKRLFLLLLHKIFVFALAYINAAIHWYHAWHQRYILHTCQTYVCSKWLFRIVFICFFLCAATAAFVVIVVAVDSNRICAFLRCVSRYITSNTFIIFSRIVERQT